MAKKFKNIKLPLNPTQEHLATLQQFFVDNFDSIQEEYSKFCKEAATTVVDVTKILKDRIDPDPTYIAEALSDLTSYLFFIGTHVADAQTFSGIYDMLFFCEKTKSMSESDRKLYTNTKTLHQKNVLAQLKNADASLEKRISVCQSILKAEMLKLAKIG